MTDQKYAGESHAKRLARVDLYSQTARLWSETKFKPEGWAVLLAGPEAAEVGALKHLIKWPADRVLFIDTDVTGLRVAETKWPGVHTLHGDIRDALDALHGESVGFAHLDFMGHLNPVVEETVGLLRDKLSPGGVVAYTFLRGREHEGQKNFNRARAIARSLIDANIANAEVVRLVKDNYRCFGYAGILKGLLGDQNMAVDLGQFANAPELGSVHKRQFAMMHLTRYSSQWSPMGVIGLQKAMPDWSDDSWRRVLEACGAGQPLKISKSEAPDRVRDWAIRFRKMGLAHSVVGEIFNVSSGSVVAWLAHHTRGTYREETEIQMKDRSVHRWTDEQEARLISLVDTELKDLFTQAEKERRLDDAWMQIPGRLGILVTPKACKSKYANLKAAAEAAAAAAAESAKVNGNGNGHHYPMPDAALFTSVVADVGATVGQAVRDQTTEIVKEQKTENAVLRNLAELFTKQHEALMKDLKWMRQAIVESNKDSAKIICTEIGGLRKDIGSCQAAIEILSEQMDELLRGLKEAP